MSSSLHNKPHLLKNPNDLKKIIPKNLSLNDDSNSIFDLEEHSTVSYNDEKPNEYESLEIMKEATVDKVHLFEVMHNKNSCLPKCKQAKKMIDMKACEVVIDSVDYANEGNVKEEDFRIPTEGKVLQQPFEMKIGSTYNLQNTLNKK